MRIIAKDTTEVLNWMYGDEEDYSYVKKKDVPDLIDNIIEYLEDIREDDNFCDNGYIGDTINLISLYKNIMYHDDMIESLRKNEKSEESK